MILISDFKYKGYTRFMRLEKINQKKEEEETRKN